MYGIIAQSAGILGALFLISSFQIKKSKLFFTFQATGSGLFLINYFMLGAWTGVLISIMSVFRSTLASVLKGKARNVVAPFLIAVPVVAGFFIYTGVETVLMLIAYCVFTVAMLTQHSRLIRFTQLFLASPLQLAHNTIVFSLGGILCESFNIVSILISVIRFGWRDFEDKGEKNER